MNIEFSNHTHNELQITNEPLFGATAAVEGTTTGASADFDGRLTIKGIPSGKHVIVFSYVGYETEKDTFEFPISQTQPIIIFLESGEELETVYISAMKINSG